MPCLKHQQGDGEFIWGGRVALPQNTSRKWHLINICQIDSTVIWAFQMVLCFSKTATLRPTVLHVRSYPKHHVTTGSTLLKVCVTAGGISAPWVSPYSSSSFNWSDITPNVLYHHSSDIKPAYRSDKRGKTYLICTNLAPPLMSDIGLNMQFFHSRHGVF